MLYMYTHYEFLQLPCGNRTGLLPYGLINIQGYSYLLTAFSYYSKPHTAARNMQKTNFFFLCNLKSNANYLIVPDMNFHFARYSQVSSVCPEYMTYVSHYPKAKFVSDSPKPPVSSYAFIVSLIKTPAAYMLSSLPMHPVFNYTNMLPSVFVLAN